MNKNEVVGIIRTCVKISTLGILLSAGCGPAQHLQKSANTPVAAYDIAYDAHTNLLSMKSIDVTPPSYAQNNLPGKAGLFQIGNATLTGNLLTAPIYITNNDTNAWTGVEMQSYQLLSGSAIAALTDLGSGWYIDNPPYGAWAWFFTSGTAGSAYTIPAGGQSADTVMGFNATSSFVFRVYLYADVPVISGLTPSTVLTGSTITISGYNFSTTPGSVIFNGITGTVQSWTADKIVATVPTDATLGNVVVDTVYANTPYSNPVKFTPYRILTNSKFIASPGGITVDTAGNLYVAVYGNNNYIEKVSPAGSLTTYSKSNKYNNPVDVAFDTAGKLYVSNCNSNNILAVRSGGGAPSVFAVVGSCPDALYFSGAGESWPLYAADGGDGTVYSIQSNGTASLFASGFVIPTAVATDASGDVYVGDCGNGDVYRINAAGTVTTTVITGLSCPSGMKLDSAGNIYILDSTADTIYEYVPSTGTYSTYAVLTGIVNANGGFAFDDAFTTLYVSQASPTNEIVAIPIQ
ncbi:MAG: IPT/TIG domain-containing protein [Deltaproteobacteria bacterium]|nr:IPT/TIG domain-containing protein [Deltaproteobacteria bacterium]MCL5277680.1 IPT/TIG domain-containing protein [Deltaproteobacteria bacterium]